MRPLELLLEPIPRPLRRRARGILRFLKMRPWENPMALLPYLRYGRRFQELSRSFFRYRYVVALLWAHELKLFDTLSSSPRSLQELASLLNILPRPLEQLLFILESQGWITRRGDTYSLTPEGRFFFNGESPQSVRGFMELFASHHASFREILRGMSQGTIPPRMNIFSSRASVDGYLHAVNTYLHWVAPELLSAIELPPIRRFIAGSMGVSFSAHLLRRDSRARVTYGCLPHLVKRIPELVKRFDVPEERIDGMHPHSGDPEEDRWGERERYDLVFLTKKLILKPEQRIGEKFVAKASQVLEPGGVLILWETVHPGDQPTPLSRAMEAVLDLGASPDGLVLTEARVRDLLKRHRFRKISFHPAGDMGSTFVVAYR